MEFELPVRLKQILLAEYDGITENQQQQSLPHKPCVAEILSQYVDQSNSEGLDFEQEVEHSSSLFNLKIKSVSQLLLLGDDADATVVLCSRR